MNWFQISWLMKLISRSISTRNSIQVLVGKNSCQVDLLQPRVVHQVQESSSSQISISYPSNKCIERHILKQLKTWFKTNKIKLASNMLRASNSTFKKMKKCNWTCPPYIRVFPIWSHYLVRIKSSLINLKRSPTNWIDRNNPP